MLDVKQFKLSNSNEIVCEVLSWPDPNKSKDKDIVVRNAIQIITREANTDYGPSRYYLLRPWLMYQETNENISILNSDHVTSVSEPSAELYEQYEEGVYEMHVIAKQRKQVYAKERLEKQREYIERVAEFMKESLEGPLDAKADSSESNVIQFPNGDETLH